MVQFFKMCRIKCDRCDEANFEVFTFENEIEAPDGWKNVKTYHAFTQNHQLCCPACVENMKKSWKKPEADYESPIVRLNADRSFGE